MTRRNGRLLTLGATATIATLAACGSGTSSADKDGPQDNNGDQEVEYVFAYEGPPGTAQEIAADIFEEALEDASDGSMTVEQYPSGQLGGESDLLEKARAGDVDFMITSIANAATVMEESGVFSLHYLVDDSEAAVELFQNDDVNNAYRELAEDNIDGMKPLTLFMLPLRHMYGDFEVHAPEDLEGKKMRVQATDTEDLLFAAYGAQTVHMAFPELYSGLQTGVVDAAEGAVTNYGQNNHYEVAPIMSLTEHSMNGQVIWSSDDTLDSLSEEQREAVDAAAAKVREEQPLQALELEQSIFDELEEKGVKFVDDVDTEAFAEISRPLQDEITQEISPDAVELLGLIRDTMGQ